MMVTQLDAQLLAARAGHVVTTLLFGLGSLVLLVACVNYANLATARAPRARDRPRKVIGARRSRLVAQYLLEAGVLTAGARARSASSRCSRGDLCAIGIDMRTSFRRCGILAVRRRLARPA
jgi:hypothetical protein